MILLVTNKDDVTTHFIANRLNKISEPYYRLNTEDLVSSVGVNLDIAGNEYILIDYQRNQSSVYLPSKVFTIGDPDYQKRI